METFVNKTFICSVFKWFSIQMPGKMVPGIWIADQYSNGGLNTHLLTKWSEYQTIMVLGIWIANHLMIEQIPMIWIQIWLAIQISTVIKE